MGRPILHTLEAIRLGFEDAVQEAESEIAETFTSPSKRIDARVRLREAKEDLRALEAAIEAYRKGRRVTR